MFYQAKTPWPNPRVPKAHGKRMLTIEKACGLPQGEYAKEVKQALEELKAEKEKKQAARRLSYLVHIGETPMIRDFEEVTDDVDVPSKSGSSSVLKYKE